MHNLIYFNSNYIDYATKLSLKVILIFLYNYDFQTYERFAHLWAEDRTQQVQVFVDSNPLNVIVTDMIKKYERQTEEVLNFPERHIIGSIQIDMGTYCTEL